MQPTPSYATPEYATPSRSPHAMDPYSTERYATSPPMDSPAFERRRTLPVSAPPWGLRRAMRRGFVAGVLVTLAAIFFTQWFLLAALMVMTTVAFFRVAGALIRLGTFRAEQRWREEQRQQRAWAEHHRRHERLADIGWHTHPQATTSHPTAAHPMADTLGDPDTRALDDFDRRLAEALDQEQAVEQQPVASTVAQMR
ncbi:MAG: hypothetical protein AAFX99_28725 [Myxococcota bacterium]